MGFSGESGAGKTEVNKQCMNYLVWRACEASSDAMHLWQLEEFDAAVELPRYMRADEDGGEPERQTKMQELEGLLGDAPPAPPLSEPDAVADRVVAYVSQGDRFAFSTERAAPAAGARAAAVIRALNRQRSRQTALPDALRLRALARVCLACLDACSRANDVRAPAVLAMLAQTFYVDHGEGARAQRGVGAPPAAREHKGVRRRAEG